MCVRCDSGCESEQQGNCLWRRIWREKRVARSSPPLPQLYPLGEKVHILRMSHTAQNVRKQGRDGATEPARLVRSVGACACDCRQGLLTQRLLMCGGWFGHATHHPSPHHHNVPRNTTRSHTHIAGGYVNMQGTFEGPGVARKHDGARRRGLGAGRVAGSI